ncbi:MAG: polysaccharide biosynthesis tyrosine autokinase [Bacteroidota bacterium]
MATQSINQAKRSRFNLRGKGYAKKIRERWQWFAILVPVSLLIGILYLQLKTPAYRVATSLLIQDQKRVQRLAERSGGLPEAEPKNLQNELGFLGSRELISQTVKYLGFEVQLFEKGFWHDQELYDNVPFNIVLDQNHPQLEGTQIQLKIISNDSFLISAEASDPYLYFPEEERLQWAQGQNVNFKLKGSFGEFAQNDFLRVLIVADTLAINESWQDRDLYFLISDRELITEAYVKELNIKTINEQATIVELAHQGPIIAKERAFLDGLTEQYIDRQLQEKNRIAEGRVKFIEGQIRALSDSIEGTVEALSSPRKGNGRNNDLRLTAGNAVQQLQQFQSQKADLENRRSYFSELIKTLKTDADPTVLSSPKAVGIREPLLDESIVELKRLYSEKVIKSVAAGDESLEMQYLNRMIKKTKETLLTNVQTSLNQTERAIRGVNQKMAQASEIVRNLPGEEQFLNRIDEQFVFNDNLYNYLLQQRMEAKMAQASSQADSKVLDPAHKVGTGPVSPNTTNTVILSLLVGFLLPLFGILAFTAVDPRVMDVEQIESHVEATVLGHILHAPPEVEDGNLWADENAMAVAENFRYLFVNLQFMAFEKPCRVIAVTSTVPNEGKTFCAVNLAQVMAANGQKVLLIGADIRKPRVHKYIDVANKFGLTNYLANVASADQVIQDTSQPRLKCIASGPVPEKPAELLDGERLPYLLQTVQNDFDYVIVDTPPSGLFADYLQVARHADINLYIVRQRYSKIEYLKDIETLRKHADLKRFYLVFNDVKYGQGYRTKYGYDYSYKYRDQVSEITGDGDAQNWTQDVIRKS